MNFNTSCVGTYAHYLLNITVDGLEILNDSAVVNGSTNATDYAIGVGNHNTTSTCANGTTTETVSIYFYTRQPTDTTLIAATTIAAGVGAVLLYYRYRGLRCIIL
jgi:hypothetical protein